MVRNLGEIVLQVGNRKKALQPASGFLIVAFLTESFPVGLIPEQPLVTPVRDDMIHDSRQDDLSFRLTEGTERMLLQETRMGFMPSGVKPSPSFIKKSRPVARMVFVAAR